MNFCFRSKFALKAFFLFKRKSFIEIHNNGPISALITYFDRVSYFLYKIKCMKKINAFFWKSKIKYAYYSKNNFVFYITYTTFMIYIIISKETSFCVCVFFLIMHIHGIYVFLKWCMRLWENIHKDSTGEIVFTCNLGNLGVQSFSIWHVIILLQHAKLQP